MPRFLLRLYIIADVAVAAVSAGLGEENNYVVVGSLFYLNLVSTGYGAFSLSLLILYNFAHCDALSLSLSLALFIFDC